MGQSESERKAEEERIQRLRNATDQPDSSSQETSDPNGPDVVAQDSADQANNKSKKDDEKDDKKNDKKEAASSNSLTASLMNLHNSVQPGKDGVSVAWWAAKGACNMAASAVNAVAYATGAKWAAKKAYHYSGAESVVNAIKERISPTPDSKSVEDAAPKQAQGTGIRPEPKKGAEDDDTHGFGH